MKLLELQAFAEENFGVDVADQAIREEPEPGEAVLLTIRNTDHQVRKICCRADLIKKPVKKIPAGRR